jgi:predicted metal-dependent hydrolase
MSKEIRKYMDNHGLEYDDYLLGKSKLSGFIKKFNEKMNLPVKEIETRYVNRVIGSVSKLNTYKDGIKILYAIFLLVIREKPFVFFGGISLG